jgi:hypothetical protein
MSAFQSVRRIHKRTHTQEKDPVTDLTSVIQTKPQQKAKGTILKNSNTENEDSVVK